MILVKASAACGSGPASFDVVALIAEAVAVAVVAVLGGF